MSRPPLPVVSGYCIEHLIGRGAHSSVWLARQESVDRAVALKILPFARADDAARFAREVEAIARVQHPGVVACHDVGTCADGLFLALELLPGGDCEALVQRSGPLPETQVGAILADAARGLQGLADLGLVHRDIKPANLLLTAEGQAQVGDLGLARRSGGGTSLSRNSLIEGTPGYMSPEQVRGADLDARSDLYSLAASGIFLLTGKPPVSAPTLPALLQRIANGPGPDLNVLLPEIAPDLRTCLAICLQHDPARRYRRPADFAADLAAIALGQPPLVARRLRQEAAEASALRAATPAQAGRGDQTLWWLAAAALTIGLLGGWSLGRPATAHERTSLITARQAGTEEAWNAYRAGASSPTGQREARAALDALKLIRAREQQNAAATLEERRLREELRGVAQKLAKRLQALPTEAVPPLVAVDPTPVAAAPATAIALVEAATPSTVNVESLVPAATPVVPATPVIQPAAPAASADHSDGIPEDLAKWVRVAEPPLHDIYGIAAHPTDPDVLIAYDTGMVVRSADRGRTWLCVSRDQHAYLNWVPPQWSPRNLQLFMPSLSDDTLGLLSVDDGKTFSAIPPPKLAPAKPAAGVAANKVEKTFLDPHRVALSDGSLWCAVHDHSDYPPTTTVQRSNDRGTTWKVATGGLTDFYRLLAANDRVLLLSLGNPAKTSTDLGRTVKPQPLFIGSSSTPCTAYADGWVIFGVERKIGRLGLDGSIKHVGTLPEGLHGGLNQTPADALAIDANDARRWYIAARDGTLARTSDAGKSWGLSRIRVSNGSKDEIRLSSLALSAGRTPTLIVASNRRMLVIDLAGGDALFSEPVPATP
jgi:hypothetical protein